MTKTLSKSKYMNGLSCIKLLWCHYNAPEIIPPTDEATQFIFDQGHEVGNLAKTLYPGIEIVRDNKSIQNTKKALEKRKPIFEGTFAYNNGYCKVDILEPVNKNEWDIIEVKSSTEVKDEHIEDAGFQLYVLQGCGLNIRKVHIMVINNEYERKGKINVKKIFTKEDITEQAQEKAETVADNLKEFQKIIAGPKPKVQYGIDCQEPKECPVCSPEVEKLEICELYRSGKKVWPLVNQGITKLKDIPASFKLNEKQKIQYDTVKTGNPHVDKRAIKEFLDGLKYPLSFFDFETISTAIPLYDGIRPYQQVPFQFSLHVIDKKGETPKHYEFLADGNGDPREDLLDALQIIPPKGTILAFNMNFEKNVLEDLAAYFPKKSKQIHSLISRLQDLIIPFKNFSYYHPLQKGSCSIKYILPALTGKKYSELEISEGGTASRTFLKILRKEIENGEKIRKDLLAYCKLDTEGMVDVVERLKEN